MKIRPWTAFGLTYLLVGCAAFLLVMATLGIDDQVVMLLASLLALVGGCMVGYLAFSNAASAPTHGKEFPPLPLHLTNWEEIYNSRDDHSFELDGPPIDANEWRFVAESLGATSVHEAREQANAPTEVHFDFRGFSFLLIDDGGTVDSLGYGPLIRAEASDCPKEVWFKVASHFDKATRRPKWLCQQSLRIASSLESHEIRDRLTRLQGLEILDWQPRERFIRFAYKGFLFVSEGTSLYVDPNAEEAAVLTVRSTVSR